MIALLLACSAPEGDLLIAHTNDLHGRVEPEKAPWLDGEPRIGGMRTLSSRLEEHRAAGDVLYLDAGDLLSGTPYAQLERGGATGGAMVDLLGALQADAFAIGNHEYDLGGPNLERLLAHAGTPGLSANLEPAPAGSVASTVIERGGIRVGVIGLTTPHLRRVVSKKGVGDTRALDVAPIVRAELERLDPDTDLLVVLSHIGVEDDVRLAEEVDGIDLIVGGHSHTPIKEAKQVGDTWIVQAGSYARSLGEVRLHVADDAISSFAYTLTDLVDPGTGSPAVEALVTELEGEVQAVWDVPIGSRDETLMSIRGKASPLGTWACDRMREGTGADVGIYNAGGLRAPIYAGEVTRRDLFAVFPFGNQVAVLTLSAEDTRALVELVGRGDPQATGLSGLVIEDGGSYTVATNDYLLDRLAEDLPDADLSRVDVQERTVFELMEAWFLAQPRPAPRAPE